MTRDLPFALAQVRPARRAKRIRCARTIVGGHMHDAALTTPTIERDEPVREAAPARGLVAGRYALCARIGRGGMGEVLLAEDLVLGRYVAVKRSRTPELDGAYTHKLRREARIAARVAHRAVVQVYDLIHERAVDHLVMELVEGPSLAAVHDRGRVDTAEVVRIGIELAAGLAAVHASGALHLDVKLENVLLGVDGQPKLTDFGIARCTHEADPDVDRTVIGTPRSMSPEQIQGEADARSDLYSLGVLMFELAAGVSPFATASELHTLSRVLGEDAPRLDQLVPGTPRALAQLVADLLEKSPTLRPQSALELQVRLWAIAGSLD